MTRLLAALLGRLLPPGEVREGLLGDLAELRDDRRSARGRLRADLWYARQLALAALRYLPRRVRAGLRTLHPHAGDRSMDALRWEIAASLRALLRAPGFAAVSVLTLGLGIGATALVFTLVDGVVLRPLAYPEPDRVVSVSDVNPSSSVPPGWTSIPNWLDWREGAESFEALGIFRGRSVSVGTASVPEYAFGVFADAGFFRAFGVAPALGRAVLPDESGPDPAPVVVLSHGLWTRGFGADADVVGRTISVDGAPHEVVGVMPAGFGAPGGWIGRDADLWRPFPLDPADGRGNRSYNAVGRLAPGTSREEAAAELAALHAGLAERWPDENAGWRIRIVPWREMVVGDAAPRLLLLLGAVALALAVACANAGFLAVNRVLGRSAELATRRALGAGRGRVARQLLAEGVLLSAGGALLGLALAAGGLRLFRALEPGTLPRVAEVALDGRVLLFTAGVLVATALAVGGLGAIAATRLDPLREMGGGRGVLRAPAGRLRWGLAVAQLAVSFALLAGAGLLARSFQRLADVDLGLDAEGVTVATVALSWQRVPDFDDRVAWVERALAALEAVPGAASVGMVNSLPLSGSNAAAELRIDGVTAEDTPGPTVAYRAVSPGYRSTLGVGLVAGRDLTAADADGADAALVNRAFVERWAAGRNPLGMRIGYRWHEGWLRVVGVVDDVRHYGPDRPAREEVWVPHSLDGLTSKSFLVRSDAPRDVVAEAMRTTLLETDPDQPVRDVGAMESWVSRATAAPRFQAALVAVAAALATALAAVGLFAALAALVGERTREIALRMAVGAPRRRVLALVLGGAGRLVAVGLATGLALTLLLGDVLAGFLHGVTPRDPAVLAAVAAGFVAVAAAAAWWPARRASSVDPATVLRDG